mmetsp:Transcript_9651/g.28907  ORF Transcript_9651/g.28907 Transcript_9651/m.28907 type:complete len:160 (-) Transcript_9651:142-621(-)
MTRSGSKQRITFRRSIGPSLDSITEADEFLEHETENTMAEPRCAVKSFVKPIEKYRAKSCSTLPKCVGTRAAMRTSQAVGTRASEPNSVEEKGVTYDAHNYVIEGAMENASEIDRLLEMHHIIPNILEELKRIKASEELERGRMAVVDMTARSLSSRGA